MQIFDDICKPFKMNREGFGIGQKNRWAFSVLIKTVRQVVPVVFIPRTVVFNFSKTWDGLE